MNYGYDYTHSSIGKDGEEYITFMIAPEILDKHEMRNGLAIDIHINHAKQTTTVYKFLWWHGYVKNLEHIKTLKDVIITDNEVPALMEELGIKVYT